MPPNRHPGVSPLDRWYLYRGPCGICGRPDARHRLWDSIIDEVRTTGDESGAANLYDVPSDEAMAMLIRLHVIARFCVATVTERLVSHSVSSGYPEYRYESERRCDAYARRGFETCWAHRGKA